MSETKYTTDHDTIRKWAEARGGRPAAVRTTHNDRDTGIIRIEFPDAPNAHDENLQEISWRCCTRTRQAAENEAISINWSAVTPPGVVSGSWQGAAGSGGTRRRMPGLGTAPDRLASLY
jgi:hypothetical protein